MSFEGYFQVLCESGHLTTADCYDWHDVPAWRCHYCAKPAAWTNLVDETNLTSGTEHGDGYVALKTKTVARQCACNNCGHHHQIKPEVFYIPGADDGQTKEGSE